jgi:hypothetical protein
MPLSSFEVYTRLAGEESGRWTELSAGEHLVDSGRGGWLGWTAVRRRSQDVLYGGVVAALAWLGEERERDEREVHAAFVEADRALPALGVDPAVFFGELAAALPERHLAEAARRFGRRGDVEPDLSAFAAADREAAGRILGDLLPAEPGPRRRIAAALAHLASGDLERLRAYAEEAHASFEELPDRYPSADAYRPMIPEERAERARRRRAVTGPLGRARAARSPEVLRAGLVVDAIRHEHTWLWDPREFLEHLEEYAAAARELDLDPRHLFAEVAPVMPESLAAALRPRLEHRRRGRPAPQARNEDMEDLRRMARDGDWEAIADLARRRRSTLLLRVGLSVLVEEAVDRGDEEWLRRHLGRYRETARAIGTDPGTVFESSARNAPAEVATLRAFAGRPPMGERVEAAISRLARGDEQRLRVFRAEVEPSLREHALPDGDPVPIDAPTRALRARSPDILLGALVVDIVTNEDFYFQDWRDLLGAMAPYHHCAAALGIDTRRFFEEAAAAGPPSLAEHVRSFGRRKDVTEAAWNFDLIQEPDGPAYYGR